MNRFQKLFNLTKDFLSHIDMKVYLICVLIATFIWLTMKLSDGYAKEIEIPIQYTNFPKGMILVNKPTTSLKVRVESQGFKMMSIALRNNKQVKIDLSKIILKQTKYKRWVASMPSHLFSYDISNQLGVEPIDSRISPDSIYFVFDSLITRVLPVKIEHKLSFVEGNTTYGDMIIEPSSVEVTGPALRVNQLDFISADSLIVEQINESFERILKIRLVNEFVSVNPDNVLVSAKVAKFSDFSSEVPIQVHSNIPNLKIRTFPAKLKIIYSIPIPEYDRISDSSFVVAVDVDSMDLLKNNHLIPRIVRKPDFVKSAHLDVDKVEFIILKQ